jgi:hypothetical protein
VSTSSLAADGSTLLLSMTLKADIWLYRKINTSPTSIDDKDVLKLPLTNPKVKKIDLHFPLGLEVTARNLKGVTIKDALDAIHKQFKKKVRLRFELPFMLSTYGLVLSLYPTRPCILPLCSMD